jgi:carboxypeptidase D
MKVALAGFLSGLICLGVLIEKSLVWGRRISRVAEAELSATLNQYANRIPGGSTFRRLSAENLPKADDHRVTNLPGLTKEDSVSQFAGHLPADPSHGGYFFYWLFESKKDSDKNPLIIWLNGGPGCSSMDGLWLELGPFRITDKGQTVRWNKHSWHEVGNLLFIDQPVGTGLSFTGSRDGMAKNDNMVNEHFYTFLQNFFAVHSRYVHSGSGRKRTRPIVFTGESHAGHYIPSLVRYLLQQNQELSENLEIVVQGIALGNPWIDPPNQYNPAEFAHGQGIISNGQVNKLKEQERECRSLLQEGKLNNRVCMSLLDDVVDSSSIGNGARVVIYDSRQYSASSRAFPPGHEVVESYLNRADVKRAIHATRAPQRYVECADPPYNALSHQDGKGVTEELIYILDAGIPVLIYSGQFDLICNHMNLEKVLDGLGWIGKDEWLGAQPGVWMQNNRPAGYNRKYKNLQSLVVLNAGHMVPMDQPEIALSMLRTFVSGREFASGPSKVGVKVSSSVLCSLSSITSVESGVPQQVQQRSLLESAGQSNIVQYYPVLMHAMPMEQEAFLRIRMQQLSSSSLQMTSALMKQAWDSLATSSFYILIEPTDQVIRFNQNRTWMSALSGHQQHGHNRLGSGHGHSTNRSNNLHMGVHAHAQNNHHLDLVITGLQYGTVYTFSLHHDYDTAQMSRSLPASFARNVHMKVGCFSPGFEQCCGRGDCVLATNSEAKLPHCQCDGGYSGAHCDHYAIAEVSNVHHTLTKSDALQSTDPSATHFNQHSPRRSLQVENVSASESICSRRMLPAATALHIPLATVPHKNAHLTVLAEEVKGEKTVSIQNTVPSSTSTSSLTENIACGEDRPCCMHVIFSILQKNSASDSNMKSHSSDFRVVLRQRVQQGLQELLVQYAAANIAQLQVKVIEIGADEGGRSGQRVTASVCGDSGVTAVAMQKFFDSVDADTAEIKKAYDVYAIQGPVVILTTPPVASTSSAGSKPQNNTVGNVRKENDVSSKDQVKVDGIPPQSVTIEMKRVNWTSWNLVNIVFMISAVLGLSFLFGWCWRQQSLRRLRYP